MRDIQAVTLFFGGDKEVQKYVLISFALVVLAGVILGILRKITVFRDYADVSTVITSIAGPPISIFIAAALKLKTTTAAFIALKYVGAGFEGILLILTIVGTWQDNRSFWKTPLALITKYTICLTFVVTALVLMMGGDARKKGESYADYRARNDHSKKMWLGLLAMVSGLIALLVKNQTFRASDEGEPEISGCIEEHNRAA